MAAGRVVASSRASVSITPASPPHAAAARCGVQSATAAASSSNPDVCCVTQSWATRSSRMMTCIIASIIAMSVPGSGCTNWSQSSAVTVRIGSITTTLAPWARARSITGHRWRLVSLVLVAHNRISRACSSCSGSPARPVPLVICTPAPTVGPQMLRNSRVAPMWWNSRDEMPWVARMLWLPASLKGMTASPPCSATTARRRAPISSSAASQVICSNSPLPFGPVRRSGCSTRSGE